MRPAARQEGDEEAPFALSPSSGASTGPDALVTAGTPATGTPEIPEAVRAAARDAPGHWIGVVDPEWAGERTPPEWAVLGEWQSDDGGDVGDYRVNPAYRPSARVLGWPEPTDPVDAAAQRAATGYGTVEAALAALAEADVTVVRGPDGGPLTAAGRDGAPVILLFTSPAHEFMSTALHHDTLPARDLARTVEGSGTMLMVNAAAAAPLFVPADGLLDPTRAEGGPAAAATSGGEQAAAGRPGAPDPELTGDAVEPRPHTTGRTP
ncbi:type VII secretion system-associated protein [Streptomyces sp. NPDC005899]|uniref:type VII secretion system-associated protein n=1 Tax=Streptomyces sp. NPDC005899 TaxID=3155716 RepID=UPI0033F3E7E9